MADSGLRGACTGRRDFLVTSQLSEDTKVSERRRLPVSTCQYSILSLAIQLNLEGMPKHDAIMTMCEKRQWVRRRIKEPTRSLKSAALVARDEIVSNSRLRQVISDYVASSDSGLPTEACHARCMREVLGRTDVLRPEGRSKLLRETNMLLESLEAAKSCLRNLQYARHGVEAQESEAV
ncbi:hypothetical protein EK21DRAFT_87807 [Setomelanomma holmii]|uniref:Uncharacterized protein n=1 Tax=Setomelanomma holmii TaxID=210430 RepID=A0A9P4HDU6_9PLEO|nr:hypothetical protein EK21DRAFT_87807 [Setomelanomma holmii]